MAATPVRIVAPAVTAASPTASAIRPNPPAGYQKPGGGLGDSTRRRIPPPERAPTRRRNSSGLSSSAGTPKSLHGVRLVERAGDGGAEAGPGPRREGIGAAAGADRTGGEVARRACREGRRHRRHEVGGLQREADPPPAEPDAPVTGPMLELVAEQLAEVGEQVGRGALVEPMAAVIDADAGHLEAGRQAADAAPLVRRARRVARRGRRTTQRPTRPAHHRARSRRNARRRSATPRILSPAAAGGTAPRQLRRRGYRTPRVTFRTVAGRPALQPGIEGPSVRRRDRRDGCQRVHRHGARRAPRGAPASPSPASTDARHTLIRWAPTTCSPTSPIR